MPKFSANLGFLWADLPLPGAIQAAKQAGFHAVECHWPYDIPASEVRTALMQTGLKMLGINTVRGDVDAGEFGLAAVPGRREDAFSNILQAIDYADKIGAYSVHVLAGIASGDAAFYAFVETLDFACRRAAQNRINILIEPLNQWDAPGYFLNTIAQAREIIRAVGAPNLRLMFDCYHVGWTEGDVINQLKNNMDVIGHIQFASVPDRRSPDHGGLDYKIVFNELDAMGWQRPLGAEYRPDGKTEQSVSWMTPWI